MATGVIDAINGKEVKSTFPWEFVIRIILGLLLLRTLIQFVRSLLLWKKLHFPLSIKFHYGVVLHSIRNLIPLFVLFAIPLLVGVTIEMFLRIMPDIGWTLLLAGILSVPIAITNMIIRSASEEYIFK